VSLEKVIHAPFLKKMAETNWKEYESSILEGCEDTDPEYPYVHVSDLADGHHGVYTFDVACERVGITPPNQDSDPDGYYMFQDEQMGKWTDEVQDVMGDDGYSVEWFHDGSISVVFSKKVPGAATAWDKFKKLFKKG